MPAFSVPLELDFSPDQIGGYLACALVLATFAMRSMHRLRYVAILSNVAFIYYAGALGLAPIFILHAILLPLNIWRLMEIAAEKTNLSHDEADNTSTGELAAKSWKRGPFIVVASEGERRSQRQT